MAKKTIDWEAIRREYRAGQLSVREIGRQHGVTHSAIAKRAKVEKWQRDLTTQVRQEIRARVQQDDQAGVATDAEIIDQAAARGVAVVRDHQRRLKRLAEISDALTAKLKQVVDGEARGFVAKTKQGEVVIVDLIGFKESMTDCFEKLSRSTGLLIERERQAFNISEEPEKAPEDRVLDARKLMGAFGLKEHGED